MPVWAGERTRDGGRGGHHVAVPGSGRTADDVASGLFGGVFGDKYPRFIIPSRSTVSVTEKFIAAEDKLYVDTGLFSVEYFFSKRILDYYKEVAKTQRLGDLEAFGFGPQIWFGKLYVCLKIKVE